MSTTPLPTGGAPTEPHELPDPTPQRRVALVPVLLAAVALVIAVVLTVTIIGLATRATTPVAVSSPPPTTPASPAPAPSPTAAVAAPRPEAGPGECVDALGDGGAVDLDTVSVAVLRDEVVARFTLDPSPPATGETLLGITATGRDRTVLLAVRLVDGAVDEVFAVALASGDGRDDDNRGEGRGGNDDADVADFDERRATVEGRDVTVTFPDDVVKDLGRDWSWSATSSSGESGDRCPAEGQLPIRD